MLLPAPCQYRTGNEWTDRGPVDPEGSSSRQVPRLAKNSNIHSLSNAIRDSIEPQSLGFDAVPGQPRGTGLLRFISTGAVGRQFCNS